MELKPNALQCCFTWKTNQLYVDTISHVAGDTCEFNAASIDKKNTPFQTRMIYIDIMISWELIKQVACHAKTELVFRC